MGSNDQRRTLRLVLLTLRPYETQVIDVWAEQLTFAHIIDAAGW